MRRKFLLFLLLFSYFNILTAVPGYCNLPLALRSNCTYLTAIGESEELEDANDSFVEFVLKDILHFEEQSDSGDIGTHYVKTASIPHSLLCQATIEKANFNPVTSYSFEILNDLPQKHYFRYAALIKPKYYHYLFLLTPF